MITESTCTASSSGAHNPDSTNSSYTFTTHVTCMCHMLRIASLAGGSLMPSLHGLDDSFRAVIGNVNGELNAPCAFRRREEGLKGMWKGVGPNIARNAIINAAELASYDQVGTCMRFTLWDRKSMASKVGCVTASWSCTLQTLWKCRLAAPVARLTCYTAPEPSVQGTAIWCSSVKTITKSTGTTDQGVAAGERHRGRQCVLPHPLGPGRRLLRRRVRLARRRRQVAHDE